MLCDGNAYAKPNSLLRLLGLQDVNQTKTTFYNLDLEHLTRLAPSQPSQNFAKFPVA